MPAIDKIILSAVEGVKKSGTIEAGTLMGTVTAVASNGTLTVERAPDVYPKVRILSGYIKPTIGDLVEILKTTGGWVCIGSLRTSGAPLIQSGAATVAMNSAVNAWVEEPVTFPVPFATTPRVVVTPSSTISGSGDIAAITRSETATGFVMRVRRTTEAASAGITWIATTA